jgi:excisionase family DNA binding protein
MALHDNVNIELVGNGIQLTRVPPPTPPLPTVIVLNQPSMPIPQQESTLQADTPLTVAQAAKKYNISKRTIYRMIDDGLPVLKAKGAVRIKATELERYLAEGETLFG